MRREAVILILAFISCEAAEIMQRIWPWLAGVKVQPFIAYTWPHDPEGIPLLWWVKYNTDAALLLAVMYVLAKVARGYSFRVFKVAAIFCVYAAFDWFMLWLDYRQSHWYYYAVAGFYSIAVIRLLWPMQKDKAKVVEWSDHSTGLMDY